MLHPPPIGPTSLTDPNPDYVPDKFTRQDYHRLYETASSTKLKSYLRCSKYRDKKFQRNLNNGKVKKVFYCSFDDLPMCINTKSSDEQTQIMITDILRWRYTIHK